jgi:hypothetical protein
MRVMRVMRALHGTRVTRSTAAALGRALVPLAASLASVAGCGYPDYGFVASTEDASTQDAPLDADAVADAGPNDGSDATDASDATNEAGGDASDAAPLPTASCPFIAVGQDLGNSVSKVPVATPISVDGDGSEWCSLRAFDLDSATCNWLEPDPLPAWAANAKARVRLAWEPGADADHSALYLDVIVTDASLHVAPVGSPVDQGSSFTLYVGAVSPLTGAYDDVADQGATAFVMAPPQPGIPARASVDVRGAPAHGLPSGVEFGARPIAGGYEIEAKFAWSVIAKGGSAAPVPALGQTIGLDLVLKLRDATGKLVRLIWHAGGVTATTCPTDPLPECDDRTWRTPKLGL